MLCLSRWASVVLLIGGIAFVGTPARADKAGQDKAIADGKKAVDDCDQIAWGTAADEFVAQGGDRDLKKGNFPSYPNPCTKKEAKAKPKPGAARFKIAENEAPRPVDRVYTNYDYYDYYKYYYNYYVAATVGGSNNCTTQTFNGIITLFGSDAFNAAARTNCNGSFVGGGSVGVNVPAPALPNPFVAFKVNQAWGTWTPPPPSVGVNVDVLGVSGGSNTFLGTPTTALVPAPASDSYKAQDNFFVILSGTANFPIMPGVGLLTHAGYGWANKTVSYNCAPGPGLCGLASTAPFSTSKDVTLGGPAVGGGLSFDVPQFGFPMIVQFDYTHLFLGSTNVQFGAPATVFTNFKVGQDVDLFTARAVIPLPSSSRPRSYSSDSSGIVGVFRARRDFPAGDR